jgi:small-conductance mechanosensitive channel
MPSVPSAPQCVALTDARQRRCSRVMPNNWPELTLAVTLALIAAYIIADVVARGVDRVLRAILPDDREERFVDRPKRIIRLVIFLISGVALAFPALAFVGYQTEIGVNRQELVDWLLNAGLRIALIGVSAYMVIRIGTAAARRFETEMSAGSGLDVIERTKRAQTLGRIIQKSLAIVVVVIAGLMVLRELQLDITPVLTGAGIVGLAVGFGAQTLVRDVISGFFLILEDQVRVGDSAVVNGTGGLVEAINLRTIVLRDEQGALHVFPNGEIKTLANMSKDFAYHVINVGVSYHDDPDRVAEAIRDAGTSMMTDPEYRPHILTPIEVYGVDAFEADRLVVKARIKTVPQKQWLVGRELQKRIARLLRERGIQVPLRQVNLKVEAGAAAGEESSNFKLQK